MSVEVKIATAMAVYGGGLLIFGVLLGWQLHRIHADRQAIADTVSDVVAYVADHAEGVR